MPSHDDLLVPTTTGGFDPLTPLELKILKLIAEAHTSREMAETLFISVTTVERHRANILREARHARPR